MENEALDGGWDGACSPESLALPLIRRGTLPVLQLFLTNWRRQICTILGPLATEDTAAKGVLNADGGQQGGQPLQTAPKPLLGLLVPCPAKLGKGENMAKQGKRENIAIASSATP